MFYRGFYIVSQQTFGNKGGFLICDTPTTYPDWTERGASELSGDCATVETAKKVIDQAWEIYG